MHKKYFHNEDKYISLSLKKFNNLKKKIKKLYFNFEETGRAALFQDNENEYAVGKYLCEDKNGKVIDEKIFLSFKNQFKEGENNILLIKICF